MPQSIVVPPGKLPRRTRHRARGDVHRDPSLRGWTGGHFGFERRVIRGAKRTAEFVAAYSGVTRALISRTPPATVILAYHNVVPRGEPLAGELPLHIRQELFSDHLDLVLESHDVVPLREVAFGETTGRRPRAAITFDDAYRGTLTAGLEELRQRRLPATIFVPPGLLGTPGFWWDLLAPAGGGVLDSLLREKALGSELKGRQDRIMAWAAAQGFRVKALPPHAKPATESELVETSDQLVSWGCHTWSHPNLVALSPDEVDGELKRSMEWLETRLAQTNDWLAYPYGLFNEAVAAAAHQIFRGALMVDGGLTQRRGRWIGRPSRIPRLQVPSGLSVNGLGLRLAGLLGARGTNGEA